MNPLKHRRHVLRSAAPLLCLFAAGKEGVTAPPRQPGPKFTVTAAELKGDLSFLSSDTLQGRYTPSPGLEVAAEFIASRFREAGLRPGGDDGYFQTAHMVERSLPKVASGLAVEGQDQSFTVPAEAIVVLHVETAAHVQHAPVLRFARMDPKLLTGVDLSGKAIVTPQPDFRSMPRDQAMAAYGDMQAFQGVVRRSKAALEVLITRRLNPVASQLIQATEAAADQVPSVGITEASAGKMPGSKNPATMSIDIPAPSDQKVTVKNVIGVLPGSDASLKNTYVFLTAHYDHIGTTETAGRLMNPESGANPKDHIYNGANDDGSGTVSVVEIARALAKVEPRPKRSIVFMTFFGEERGELGSTYYVSHPVFPIDYTIADVNLEQVGRTDELDGGKIVPRTNSLSLTGFDYSDVTGYLARAGERVGVKVYKDDQASDAYFRQSDNAAFADHGVPAHSVTVAFDYPDYHGVGDEWQKVNYDNMARVDRAIGLAVFDLANAASAPGWAVGNPKTAAFRGARK